MLALLIVVLLAILFFPNEKQHYITENISFIDKNDTLSGVLIIPNKHIPKNSSLPLVIFVHGDGAIPADNFGYYGSIWNALAKEGIASLSWSKKGVGHSTGNWLDQSMNNRAAEIVSAIDSITLKSEYDFSSIGLIGFSQAGWVLPKVPIISEYPDFMISVSGAINWKQQSNYMTRKRMEDSRKSLKEIEEAIAKNEQEFQFFDKEKTYGEYIIATEINCKIDKSDCSLLEENRFHFIQKNINSDATTDLQKTRVPVFGMFGADDLNVDFEDSYNVYREILSQENATNYQLKIYPEATHGLLKSDQFNTANPGLGVWIKMQFYGKDSFAEGVIDDIVAFVALHSK